MGSDACRSAEAGQSLSQRCALYIRQNFIHVVHPSSFRCDAAHTIDDGRARLINVALTYRMIELKEEWENAKKQYIFSETVGNAMSWMVRLDGLRAAECRFNLQSLRDRSCVQSGIESPHNERAGSCSSLSSGAGKGEMQSSKREWLNVSTSSLVRNLHYCNCISIAQ